MEGGFHYLWQTERHTLIGTMAIQLPAEQHCHYKVILPIFWVMPEHYNLTELFLSKESQSIQIYCDFADQILSHPL